MGHLRALLFFVILTIIPCSRIMAFKNAAEIESRLHTLDDVLEKRDTYAIDVKEKIAKGRLDLNKSHDALQQYNSLRNLYELYRNYRIDSALYIAEQRLDIARKLGDPSKISSATLNLAEAYTMSGNPDIAIFTLDTLKSNTLQDHHLKYQNNIYKKAYHLKKNLSLSSRDRIQAINKVKLLIEEELKSKDRNSRGYLTLKAEQLKDAGMTLEAVDLMEEAQRKFDFSDNAALLYMMGETYFEAGRMEEAILYLSQAATLDIENGNKEYKALILLASALYNTGDIDRAFSYINTAFDDAAFSKANLRTEEIMQILPIIHNTFYQKEKEIRKRTIWVLCVALAFIVLLGIFIIMISHAYKKERKMLLTIETINKSLEMQNRDLLISQELKLDAFREFMVKFAQYLNQTKNFRRSIFRLLKSSQFDRAISLSKEHKDKTINLSDFQEMFDVAFLSMFPDFLEKINSFMTVPIEPKENLRLSPEIRLAALMRLGINSTDVIAQMFDYSTQSVYNLRSTLKSLLKVDWEEFEKGIKEI